MPTFREKIQGIRENPAHSFWLKAQLEVLMNRDCLDAARDAEYLAEVLSERANALINGENDV